VGELGEDGQALLSPLLALVDDEDIEVTLSAVWALGEVGGPHSDRVLQRLTRSKTEAVRQAAQDALAALHVSDM
jgi:HEAT repeat protein